jgi:hypothetical protein
MNFMVCELYLNKAVIWGKKRDNTKKIKSSTAKKANNPIRKWAKDKETFHQSGHTGDK